MNLRTFFNRVWLLIAASLTSGEDLMPDENGTSGGVIAGAARLAEEAVSRVEAVTTDVIREAKIIAGNAEADALAIMGKLGAIHTTLGAGFKLSDEIIAARGAVEQAIVNIAKHFAQAA